MANITIVANFDLTKNPVDFANIVSALATAGIQYEVLNTEAPKAEKPKARKSTQTTKWSDEFPKSVYLAYGKKLKVLTSDGKKVKSDSREMVYKTMVADGYDWWCDSKHTTKASQRYC